MVTNLYPVELGILLKPVGIPKCRISIADQRYDLTVDKEQWVNINFQGHGKLQLLIEQYDKAELDPTTALIIDQLKFNEITSYKFVYQGVYYPKYPQHLISNSPTLPHQNYLSWNGIWQLDFTLPIYTWIHEVEDLGWVYD
jgi:hypothetical protein